ncbi:RNA polymerase sporulation sigma factor SigF [Clostridium massiliamazoniense]|uniref:RNA polymerase sporulation sigma factor SigF n=1 Tax=Clostridium massiliamazoniense TaxID=1347366 RepID=UPI0006D7EA5B|nr:RNA polymerase sporulation sigma factor SigF [Clostridium massiliamazoniense]
MNTSNIKKYGYNDNKLLVELAKKGDKEAMNTLVEINTPLVSSLCKKFLNRGYEYEDIFQLGCMGLVKAINNFDSSYDVKFSTYAVPMILGEIKRFLRDDGIIKVSRNLKVLAQKLHFQKEILLKELGREPTIDELANYVGVDKEEILLALESVNNMSYLHDTIHQDEGSPILLIDKISEDSDEQEDMIEKIALKEAIRDLDSKSRKIIVLRYFKDKTQSEVAKLLGISQVQVSRIEKKILVNIKDKLKE